MKLICCTTTFALTALLLVGCASDELAPPTGLSDPGLSNVRTENSAARAAAIGDGGGTITATGSNGAVYTLTVPAEAVDSSVEIRMYPISAITGYPLSAGLKAGVHLEPEGFVPRRPLTLTIDLPSAPNVATIAAIASARNAEGFHAFPAVVDGSRVSFAITHFSQYSTGDAELDEYLAFRPGQVAAQQFQHDLAVTYNTTNANGQSPDAAYRTIMGNWYSQVIEPLANQLTAASDFTVADNTLSTLIREFNTWHSGKSFCEITADADDIDFTSVVNAANQAISSGLLNYLIVANQRMVLLAGTDPNGPSDVGVAQMSATAGLALYAQLFADLWGLITPTNGLDLESVLNGMPIKVAIVSETLPPNFAPGSVGNLNIRAGVRILDRAVRTSPAVFVSLSNLSSSMASPTSGSTNSQGVFTSSVQWAHGSQTLTIDVIASLPHAGRPLRSRVRVFDRITKQATLQPFQGKWRKDDHAWIDQSGVENPNGLMVQTLGTTHIQAFSTFNQFRMMFELPITWTDNKFSGSALIGGHTLDPIFQTWMVTATGEVRPDSSLKFEWLATHGTTTSWHGSDVLPFVK